MSGTHALRTIIVDDEPLARQVLREYLSGMPAVEIIAECANGFEAVKAVAEQAPDLVLLDVQMPKLDGFEVVDLIGRATPVIFVTAYDDFAVRAFEVHAVDYLLKPVSAERLAEAIARVRVRVRGPGQPATPPVSALRPPVSERGPAERILVRDGTRVHVIDVDALDYVQARDDYVGFHSGGQEYLKEQPLAEVEAELDPRAFVRIHRSFIVNLARIARVEPLTRDSRVVILKDGRRLPVSRSGYQRLTALLDGA
ncbi:MAG TPA: LytTR family DNA-binding domain-containing protein [Vicinamibacterales bacterium]|jgi:two-component system, LytTR family, response regulator|nr:LytTR family DNA-binding domain-containing protein [Vicinamibacterales bacterium]